jgi:hypothetical protein
MNAIIWEVLIGFLLFVVFGIIPTYVCCSHNDHINHECYLRLEETQKRAIQNV